MQYVCPPAWNPLLAKQIEVTEAKSICVGLASVSLEDSRADPDQNGNASSSAEVLTSDWTEDDESSSQGTLL